MWYFKTFGLKFFTAASVYCSVHSLGSDLKIQHWNYNWDKSHGIHDNSKFGLKPDTLNVVKHQQSYHKLIIFIRHGQYHLNRKKSEEKVLTDIGWRQAYAAEGIRIDKGFQIHLHCKPITKQGLIAYNGPFYCPNHCCSILNNNSIINIIQCDCPCHRMIEYKPIETIVFIGHANVFRYWICKLLQLPIEGWLRLNLGHGSISTFYL
uniref:Serine/threonine-protein phosphatase PGAM5, mitochondrial n=1 Tax=Schistosoma haematobium TaxID=6185 RepID=A0A095CD40_SCHHA